MRETHFNNFGFFFKKLHTPNLTNPQFPAEMYAQKQDIFYEEIFSDGGENRPSVLWWGGRQQPWIIYQTVPECTLLGPGRAGAARWAALRNF